MNESLDGMLGHYSSMANGNPSFKCFILVKSHFWKTISVLPVEKFPSFAILRSKTGIVLQHLIIQLMLCYLSSGRLRYANAYTIQF